jgi:hypothetical protein
MRTNSKTTEQLASTKKGGKNMSEEPKTKPVRTSSAYTRVVGNKRFEVLNTKQTKDLPKKAYNTKWAVVRYEGNRIAVIGNTAKKYDAIDILLRAEIAAKEAAKKDDEKSDN